MKVKKYIVSNLPDAVQQIRRELGSDAVILNTKEVRVGGFLGLFRKRRMEVIAAVDETVTKKAPRVHAGASAGLAGAALSDEPFEQAGAVVPMNIARDRYAQGAVAGSSVAAPAVKPEAGLPLANHNESVELLAELRAMKTELLKMTQVHSAQMMPEAVLVYSKRLAEQGVEFKHVELFAKELCTLLEAEPEQADVPRLAREVLCRWLQPAQGEGITAQTRIVNFVGPTGVGKTTTIAKLAAEQSLAQRRQVGLITADTYRIAAVDQLRTYADILNIPLEVVFSPNELARAYHKLADCNLILMDTAGRNYRNELYVSEVNSLLAPGEAADTILVLSMTHKYTDMKQIAAQFAQYGVKKLLLTKLDETDTFGAILNLTLAFQFQISYTTYGQNVPDDLKPFVVEEMIDRLLGEPAYA